MKIGVDLDEVVAKLVPKLIKFLNTKYDKNIKETDIIRYDFGYLYGLSKPDFYKEIQQFYISKDFRNIKPVKGSQSSITRLTSDHWLFAITARPPSTKFETNLWLDKYFHNKFVNVIYTDGSAKGDICNNLGIDYLIDDHINYINEACSKGVKCLLMQRTWNKNSTVPKNAKVVKDWKEIERLLK